MRAYVINSQMKLSSNHIVCVISLGLKNSGVKRYRELLLAKLKLFSSSLKLTKVEPPSILKPAEKKNKLNDHQEY